MLPLICALFYAPLAFGGTTQQTASIIDALLFASFAGWLIGLLLFLRLPSLPGVFWGSIGVLLVIGGCAIANPGFVRVPGSWQLLPIQEEQWLIPSTVDQKTSLASMIHWGALLSAVVVVADLSSHRGVRWLLLKMVALSGLLVSLVGILQKAAESDAMLWATSEESGKVFFGAFRYHTNAAAFLAMSWPASAALWIRSFSTRGHPILRSLWFISFFFTWLGMFVNTSKIGHLVALGGVAILVVAFRKTFFQSSYTAVQKLLSAMVLLVMGVCAVYPAFSLISDRWAEAVTTGGSLSGRLNAYSACTEAIAEGGIWGYGPGTFSLIFPYFTGASMEALGGFWRHAHQDYLQFLIEWGWGGFVTVAVLVFGGVWIGCRIVRDAHQEGRKDISATIGLMALGSVLLIAAFDFPLQIPAIQLLFVVYLAGMWARGGGKEVAPYSATESEPQVA